VEEEPVSHYCEPHLVEYRKGVTMSEDENEDEHDGEAQEQEQEAED